MSAPDRYRAKRDFAHTPEPGADGSSAGTARFDTIVTALHRLRVENAVIEGVLW